MASTDSQDLPRSMKNLWTLLSGSLDLKSLQFIADELEQSQNQLMDGILFYKPHDPNKHSLENLNKKTNLSIKPHFLHKMSIFLNLDAYQCSTLFQSYLLYEYKGTPEMIKSLLSNEKQMKELFENLWHYYYSERLFSLFCFKQILSNWKTSDHIYMKIFHDFLKHVNANNEILVKLIDQLKSLINYNFETRSKFGQYFTDKFYTELKENNMKEQIEVLQLLLLYYKNFEPTIENVNDLIKLFIDNGFESKENCSPGLNIFNGFLKALLIVQCFDPNYYYKCQVDGIDHSIFKAENLNSIKNIHSMILNMNISVPANSLIFLSWMVVSVLHDSDSGDCVERLGTNAFQLKIFKYLNQVLNSSNMLSLKGSFVYNLIFEIIGNLLAVTFTIFDFDKFIQNEPTLGNLLILLFSNDLIAKMIFESSLASGLGLCLRYALDMFPFKTHFLLSLLHSLSQTNSCKNMFEKVSVLNTLTSYTEKFDPTDINYSPIDANTIVLLEDKPIYDSPKVIIEKGAKGTLFHLNGNRLVKWSDIIMDGWKLVYYRLKYLISQIRQGQTYAFMMNDEVVLNEISKIAFICSELIAHSSHMNISCFKSIIKQLIEVFKLLVNFNQATIRLFMAAFIELCVNIIKFNYFTPDQTWFLLTEKKFFPYMIGFSNQFNEILAGTDTNISTLGYILSSDESIKGNYELTFAFLELILNCVKQNQFVEENLTIASFIFIIKDIFPSHKLWNYIHEKDAHKIERMCIEIFYNVLNRIKKQPNSKLKQIEKICTILLMEGNSAEHLLNIIKNGEQVVKTKILNSGNDFLLSKDDQIISARTSLSILSYLLELYSEVNQLSSQKGKSVIENIIYSSTNNSNPNMLLIFTYFVYQKYDIHLSINAIQLLSHLAYRFPMSMLACFGSNTEFIRDHFLFRLETLTEDINFKIALLNFLSICVEHQPGLVEMFLNVSNNQGSVLNSILEILEEKLEGQYLCPFELHQSSLQFVAKFWLRPNIIAINLLNKNEKFWKLITFPLFSEEDYNNSLCSFILKILSREIFYNKMLEKNSTNKELEKIFEKMKQDKIFDKLSSHIRKQILKLDISDDLITFVDSWKDFLASWTKFMPVSIDSLKTNVINDIIQNLLTLLSDNVENKHSKIINKFANLLLIISSDWKSDKNEVITQSDFYKNVNHVFKNLYISNEIISFSALISLNSFLLKTILCSNELSKGELFPHICGLLNNSLKLFNKQLNVNHDPNQMFLNSEKRLITVNLFIVITMLENVGGDCSKYFEILRQYEITEQIFNLLLYFIHHHCHLDLAQNLILYFVKVSHFPNGSDILYNLNIINSIVIYFKIPHQLFTSTIEDIQLNYIHNMFSFLIRTVINMTIHLKHYFIDSCVSFIAIYSDTIQEICKNFRKAPKMKSTKLVLLVFELCSTLSKYASMWHSNHSASLKNITQEILLTSNSVIAYILRPNVLVQCLENSQINMITSSHHHQSLIQKDTKEFSKMPIFDDFHNLALQILFHSQAFLLNVSPNLLELLEDKCMCEEKHTLIISTNFSLPNPDSNEILTFGSLINLINHLINSIHKLEKEMVSQIKESKKAIFNINIDSTVSLLELSLTLISVQMLIATSSPKLNQIDKRIFFREINNEVNNFKSNLLSKPHRRQNSLSTLTGASPIKSSSNASILEKQYIKLIFNLMENVIQIN